MSKQVKSTAEQDQLLLDRIEILEKENAKLKLPNQRGPGAMHSIKVSVDYWLRDNFLILIMAFALLLGFGTDAVTSAISKPTGNFYPEYGYFACVKQEITWGDDTIVWQGDKDTTPEQLTQKVVEFRTSWEKAHGRSDSAGQD